MASNKISLSLGTGRRPPAPTNGIKRPRAALQEDDDEGQEVGRLEKVSHFDRAAGGAVDESQKKEETGPLVIPKQSNRDWREAANARKRQKSGLPSGAQNGVGGGGDMDVKMQEVEAADAAKKPGFGLNTYAKQGDGMTTNGHTEPPELSNNAEAQADTAAPKAKTDDEIALDALLGKTATDQTLIIAQTAPISESEAFQHDFRSAPDMASLDAYAAVPVEQFGAALLRGMGWKDGEGIGSQRGKKLPKAGKDTGKPPERRAALLGIGAKEDASLAGEMGAWGRGARGGKEVKIYNPVLLRDRKTGEMFTEEELKKKQEREERVKYEEEFERKEREREKRRKRDGDGEERDRKRGDSRDRRREKGRGRERDERREPENRRERDDRRDRDTDRDRDRRQREEESDEEYHRRKEKERRRRKEREGRSDEYDSSERSRHHREDDRDRRRDRRR